MKLSKNDLTYLLASILLLIVFSYLLYRDFNQKLEAGSSKPIGEIYFKQKVAQRKYKSQVVWENLEQHVKLYNQDSIRTAEQSEAVITLNDGTRIEVEENSMIVLNVTEKSMDINFVQGSVQAKRTGNADGPALNIRSGEKVVKITNSDVKLSGKGEENLSVTVERGEAKVESGGKTEKVGEKEQASMGKTGGIAVRKISLIPLAPVDGQRYFSDTQRIPLALSWEKVEGAGVTLEVALDRSFFKTVVKQTLNGNTYQGNFGEGIYYWRLSALDPATRQTQYSSIQRFSVAEKKAMRLTYPANGAVVDYMIEEPMLNFSWTKNDLASSYELEVASDAGFANIVKKTDSFATSISLRFPAGEYYWRIRTKASIPDAVVTSAASKFVVVKRDKVLPPVLSRPTTGQNIARIFFEKGGVTFNWIIKPEIVESELWLSPNPAFPDGASFRYPVAANFKTVIQAMNAGNYFWRVRGKDKAGNWTEFSAVASFTVVDMEKLQLFTPENGAEYNLYAAQSTGIGLGWKKVASEGAYNLTVAKSAELANPIVSENTNVSNRMFKDISAGSFYWRVRFLSSDGIVLSESEIRRFEVSDRLLDPVIVYPPNNTVVDMTRLDHLLLKWERVPGADSYSVKLYQQLAPPKLVYEVRTKENELEIRDLSILDVGNFAWSVQALQQNRLQSKPVISAFAIYLDVGKDTPDVISPEKQFVRVE